jgi:WD40 repeat protein
MLTADLGSDPPIAVSRDGTLIAKTLGTDAVRLYRIEMSKVVRSLPVASGVERDSVVSLAVPVIDYSPDGRWLATAVWGAVQLRDSSGSVVSVTRLGSSTNRCSLRFARDGGSLLAASSELGLVRLPILFPIAGSPKLGPPEAIDPEPAFFITDVSPDGSRAILTSFESGLVKIVNLSSKAQAAHWSLPGAAGAAFVNGDTAVIANSVESNNGAPIEIHDAATGKLLRTVDYPNGAHVHVSADGSWALVGSGSEHTYLLKTADWSPGPALPTEVQGRGTQPAIAPDNRLIAFGCGDMVELVSAADGSVLAHLQSPQSGTYLPGLTFSPDGATLALWWENGQLTLWDLRRLRGELATRGLDW